MDLADLCGSEEKIAESAYAVFQRCAGSAHCQRAIYWTLMSDGWCYDPDHDGVCDPCDDVVTIEPDLNGADLSGDGRCDRGGVPTSDAGKPCHESSFRCDGALLDECVGFAPRPRFTHLDELLTP